MVQEDPSFHMVTDEESGETILKGMGELHLDIKIDILKRTHGVEVEVGEPQVAYRESITKRLEDELHPQEAVRWFRSIRQNRLHYRARRARHRLPVRVKGDRVATFRENIWPAVEKGFESCIDKGVLAGFPCLDLKFTLNEGGFHAVDSSAIAFEIAAKAAYRQSMPKAGPQLLEPIMNVDVFTPDDYVGDVIGDLNRRRGHDQIPGDEARRCADQGRCAAERNVWLHWRLAHHDLWAGPVLHVVLALCSLPEQRRGRSDQGSKRASSRQVMY